MAPLAGVWEGLKGQDNAPSETRGLKRNTFKEQMAFEPMAPVRNHEQTLHGLRYRTTAWQLGQTEPFHEELGYWLWDARDKQILRCFLIPRGVALMAGGTAEPTARNFELSAAVGSDTYGILSNRFLNTEFKTVRYLLNVTIHDDDSFSYEEDSQLKIKGRPDLFHHTDKNTLRRVA